MHALFILFVHVCFHSLTRLLYHLAFLTNTDVRNSSYTGEATLYTSTFSSSGRTAQGARGGVQSASGTSTINSDTATISIAGSTSVNECNSNTNAASGNGNTGTETQPPAGSTSSSAPECPSTCTACASKTVCTACVTGYDLSGGACVQSVTCAAGQYKENGACKGM